MTACPEAFVEISVDCHMEFRLPEEPDSDIDLCFKSLGVAEKKEKLYSDLLSYMTTINTLK